MPLNSVMRSSPPLPLVTGHGHDIRWGQVVRGAPVIQPSLPGVTHSDHTGEGRQHSRPPRDSRWSNNSISIVCKPGDQAGRAASVGGDLGQRGVRDIAQIMQHSAECCSHSCCSDKPANCRDPGNKILILSSFLQNKSSLPLHLNETCHSLFVFCKVIPLLLKTGTQFG